MTTSNEMPPGCKVGDRYKFTGSEGYYYIYEILENSIIVIDSKDERDIGKTEELDQYVRLFIEEDAYLGNFAKSNKFEELYNLMNS